MHLLRRFAPNGGDRHGYLSAAEAGSFLGIRHRHHVGADQYRLGSNRQRHRPLFFALIVPAGAGLWFGSASGAFRSSIEFLDLKGESSWDF